jgi:hypothetical protein
VLALMTRMCRSWARSRMRVAVGAAGADVVEASVVAEGDEPGVVDAVGSDSVVGVGGAVAGAGLGAGSAGSGRGGAPRERSVRAPGVADAGEDVQQGLEFAGGGGLVRLRGASSSSSAGIFRCGPGQVRTKRARLPALLLGGAYPCADLAHLGPEPILAQSAELDEGKAGERSRFLVAGQGPPRGHRAARR